jgi:hypothetical protein
MDGAFCGLCEKRFFLFHMWRWRDALLIEFNENIREVVKTSVKRKTPQRAFYDDKSKQSKARVMF